MKDSYNKSIRLQCATCGSEDFDSNEDKTYIKCVLCNREYSGGYDELVEYNQERINAEVEETKKELASDLHKDITDMFKKAFKGSKNFKIK